MIHIHRTPLEYETVGHERKKRWCFKCRDRFIHNKVVCSEKLLYDEKGELINGYYEPFLVYNCRNCGEEHIEFAS